MRLKDMFEAAQQLGWDQAIQNGIYRVALRLGWYKLGATRLDLKHSILLSELFTPTDKEEILALIGKKGCDTLISQAEEIVGGNFERFGSGLAAIDLTPLNSNIHWSDLERQTGTHSTTTDIKEIWEPARFAWAVVLGRAFYLTQEQKYLNAYLSNFHLFIENNPIDHGPNWTSGQEVGIRMINNLIAARLFESGLTEQTKNLIAGYTTAHAERARKTLIYARSQNNNHYLVESIALLTASIALPDHNKARSWYRQGMKGIKWCLKNQIKSTGEYIQHSTNYHRLMLQAMVWAVTIQPAFLDDLVIDQVLLAIDWLTARVDKTSGGVPNLGANDGALLFQLDGLPFTDYRGVLQQALRAFTITGLKPGAWDEGALWLGLPASENITKTPRPNSILRTDRGWGLLRVIEHTDRPSHADHLHFDLWWKGLNICLDPGTFSYNLPTPWDNPLTVASAHNTVTINGFDQMRKVSKFLYLDWGNSWIESSTGTSVLASTDVWDRFGILHQREVGVVNATEWLITDYLTSKIPHDGDYADLRWNFPDAPWTLFETENGVELSLRLDVGKMTVQINGEEQIFGLKLVRGGMLAHGQIPASVTEGWHSRGYLSKEACLSLSVRMALPPNLAISTRIRLDEV